MTMWILVGTYIDANDEERRRRRSPNFYRILDIQKQWEKEGFVTYIKREDLIA